MLNNPWRAGILGLALASCMSSRAEYSSRVSASSGCPATGMCRPHPRPPAIGLGSRDVHLLVEPADGVAPVSKAIDSAQSRVFVSAYLLSQRRIVRALERAAAQGVHVYVMLDRSPYGVVQQPRTMFGLLRSGGVLVKWAPPRFRYSHAKFMVLDDRQLIVSSANFTQSGFSSDRDFLVFDRNPVDVRQADNIFRADWDRIAPVVDDADMVVSPPTSRRDVYGLLARGRHEVDLYSEELFDRGVIRRLVACRRRGVRVRVLVASVTAATKSRLTHDGIQIRTRTAHSGLYIHAKAMIVDRRIAFVGSENISQTSLDRNRELGVLIRKPGAIARLRATFDRDWGGR